ncbi:DUF5666 domain-containing protein [Ferrimonas balearica]|uniref:DUF5666 domain-containing protein n=1 Tax=Ferrimonas balearica TaxID=44012 RepID=UPI001C9A1DDC|nr:DUF5666 domain-containing protein [Ferrimonas balearica]MBY5993367.1 hypothetical protein [Ferrimonas balearica]
MHRLLLPALLATTLGACGSDSAPDARPESTTLPAVIQGPLTRVDGTDLILLNTQVPAGQAHVEMADQGASLSALKPGMVVTVQTDGHQAIEVDYDPLLRGPVSEQSDTRLVVAGQTVWTDAARQHAPGRWVEISGHYQGNGIQASYVGASDPSAEIQLEGQLTQLDREAKRFHLGPLSVAYRHAAVDGLLTEGGWVEVSGTLDGSELVASEVESEAGPDHDSADRLTISGLISWVNQDATLMILNQQWPVALDSRTEFEHGSPATLTVGQWAEVEGRWQAEDRRLLATELELGIGDAPAPAPQPGFEVTGRAQIDAGQLTLNGIPLVLAPNAQFEDGLNHVTLDGEWVELEGYQQDGQFLVMELERADPGPTLELEGPVTRDPATLWGYDSIDDSLAIYAGQWVKLKCQYGGAEILSQCVLNP